MPVHVLCNHTARTSHLSPSHSYLCFVFNKTVALEIYPLAPPIFFFFFFNDPAPTEISPFPLHAALPISSMASSMRRWWPLSTIEQGAPFFRNLATSSIGFWVADRPMRCSGRPQTWSSRSRSSGSTDRKSTRLNSSHSQISYAVFCLKKKK